MATLDSSAVNLALPTLAVEFDAKFDALQWVVLAYLLVITGLLLPLGRAADALGRRRLFVAGLATFVVGSLLSGLAVNVWMLVACRVLQGLGGAATQAIGAALVIDAFPHNERGRAMGWVLSAVSAGLVAGPLAGGVLVGTVGWRWIFYLNVPVGLVSLALGLRPAGNCPQRSAALRSRGGGVAGGRRDAGVVRAQSGASGWHRGAAGTGAPPHRARGARRIHLVATPLARPNR